MKPIVLLMLLALTSTALGAGWEEEEATKKRLEHNAAMEARDNEIAAAEKAAADKLASRSPRVVQIDQTRERLKQRAIARKATRRQATSGLVSTHDAYQRAAMAWAASKR